MYAGSRSPGKGRKDAGNKLPVKYKSPEGEEWSGRGRLPKWLETAEAEGRTRDEFLSKPGSLGSIPE
jgi:DNA-binding protein H-NS